MNNPSRLAVIIPALNEEDTIAAVVARVPFPSARVTVVDNGSSDATAARAAAAGAQVVLTRKQGYGSACLAGVDRAHRAGRCGSGARRPQSALSSVARARGYDVVCLADQSPVEHALP